MQRLNHRRCESHRRVTAADPVKGPPSAEQVGAVLADLNCPVGDQSRAGEDLMVEIRVAVADAARVPGLMRRLAGIFGRSSLSFDRSRMEVWVTSEWESRTVAGVIDAVASWLAEDGADSATLSVGDRYYTMASSESLAVGR